MNLLPLSFLNDTQEFLTCSDCDNESRYRCRSCYGTGRICKKCFNTGFRKNISAKIEQCDCGIKRQKAYFFESISLNIQSLVNIPKVFNGDIKAVQEILEMISSADYHLVSKAEYVYSRFVFTYTRIEQFIIARYSLLSKFYEEKNFQSSYRGFIYVDALQLNDTSYCDAINEILQSNQSSVIVYIGISHNYPNSMYPYLPHITKNLHRPAFFFATPEWFESYKYLHALWLDKKNKSLE